MAGGIIQLVAYGAQDIYLTDNPQITFFKTVFRRHTNFSFQPFTYTFNDKPNFGTKSTLVLPRLGDLVSKMYLKITISGVEPNEGGKFAWTRRLGHAILEEIVLEMGGERIDKQTGTWLDIWYELAYPNKKNRGYLDMIGDVPELTKYDENDKPEYTILIPLQFWFNKYIGLSLPVIAIQYHRIKLHIRYAELNKLIITNDTFDQHNNISILNVDLITDYVYLDKKERYNFATMGHEYLIEQVQFTGINNAELSEKRYKLHYNFPTKELVWVVKNGNFITNKKFLCYTHDDDWTEAIQQCAKNVLRNSLLFLRATSHETDAYGNKTVILPGEDPPDEGVWEESNK